MNVTRRIATAVVLASAVILGSATAASAGPVPGPDEMPHCGMTSYQFQPPECKKPAPAREGISGEFNFAFESYFRNLANKAGGAK